MRKALRKDDLKSFMDIVRSLFAGIPYILHLPAESYYHSLFYIILSLMGASIDIEVLTDKGRIDGFLEFEDRLYSIEFKYGEEGTSLKSLTSAAMRQIKKRKYYERFMTGNKRVILLGVGFAGKKIGYRKSEKEGVLNKLRNYNKGIIDITALYLLKSSTLWVNKCFMPYTCIVATILAS